MKNKRIIRLFCLLFVTAFLLSSCTSSEPAEEETTTPQASASAQGEALHSIAAEHLASLNCVKSYVESYDAEKISKVRAVVPEGSLKQLVRYIVPFFHNYYSMKIVDRVAKEQDMVRLNLSICDRDGKVLFEEKEENSIYVVAEAGAEKVLGLQSDLIGKKIGDSGEYNVPENAGVYFTKYAGHVIKYEVMWVYDLTIVSDDIQKMLESNGILTPADLYRHLFTLRVREEEALNRYYARLEYLDHCMELCSFSLDEGDKENMYQDALKAFQNNAMGLALRDYWKMIRDNTVYYRLPEDPYEGIRFVSNTELRRILFVGVLAQAKGLNVSDEEMEKIWHIEKQTSDSASWLKLKFELLEDKLLTACDPVLENSRYDALAATPESLVMPSPAETAEDSGDTIPISSEIRALLVKIQAEIARISARVLEGEGTEEEKTFMSLYPRADYDANTGRILIRLKTEEKALEEGTALIRKLIGDYGAVQYAADPDYVPNGQYH